MSRQEMRSAWITSSFTGLVRKPNAVPRRPHDPDVHGCSAELPRSARDGALAVGGAGWTAEAAQAACFGEAIERWQTAPLPQDHAIEAPYESWPLGEPVVSPDRWVLFHPDQYARPGFPFVPLRPETRCRWACCRDAQTGDPWWVPENFVFLEPRSGERWPLAPAISTGMSSGQANTSVVLRGLQEVIERDALVGAWWGRYPLVEHETDKVIGCLAPGAADRLLRPNLCYRCYRVQTPFSAHVAIVTLEGQDREGWCFSVGSACPESCRAAWDKAFLEAVQGRHYVRYLSANARAQRDVRPTSFAEHALYYSRHPEMLSRTVFPQARPESTPPAPDVVEGLPDLAARLGADRPVLVRNLTPPGLAAEDLGWVVVRVLVPGLQRLHGHHGYPFLGGPLWGRPVRDWDVMWPHPFP